MALALLALLAPAFAAARPDQSFLAVERQVESLHHRVVDTTVAIRIGGISGSGVIISPDGYILTAGHVTEKPGQRCAVALADGRVLTGTTLGLDSDIDYGLLKVDNASDLPAAPIGDSNTLREGEWVIATGHPLGRHAGRPPVVRLGRVLGFRNRMHDAVNTQVTTDAPLISGDSGGPLFDLTGRIVGINAEITGIRREGVSFHTLINLAKRGIDALKKGEVLTEAAGPPAAFTHAMSQLRIARASNDVNGAINALTTAKAADPTDAGVRLQLAKAYAHAHNPAAALSALAQACALGYNDADALRSDADLAALTRSAAFRDTMYRLELLNGIPGARKSDHQVADAAAHFVPELGRGSVRVFAENNPVAMGLVMSSSGDVLTKASELPSGDLACALSDGRIVRATLVKKDPAWDVALLHVAATGLQPASFADSYTVGEWTFTPEPSGRVLGAGVVGVGEMPVKGRGISRRPLSNAFMGVAMEELEPEALRQLGLSSGVRLIVEPAFAAAKAGVLSGDILLQVDSTKVSDTEALTEYLLDKKPGDAVTLLIVRGGQRMSVSVVLGMRPAQMAARPNLAEWLSGDISRVQGPFPTVLHHDTVLRPSAMGGPVVDDAGRCIGMNIARADRTSTYALPARVVRSIYEHLKR